MLDANESRVMEVIRPGDRVLDIGGWARCFNRANYVIDSESYETRGIHYQQILALKAQGGPTEHFTAETWIQRDICDREPWPFPDKFFDYCTCSHTLEDIRDPLWVCSEMIRVSKAGYIEIPSILFEMSRGREPGVPVGLCHHRWLIEIEGNTVVFRTKAHHIHGDRSLSLPPEISRRASEEQLVTYLFWEGAFNYCEQGLDKTFLAKAAQRLNPEGLCEEDETDRLKAELADMRAELDRVYQQNGVLQEQLRLFDGVGASGVKLARRLRRVSSRYPRLSSLIRRMTRVA